jgi:two-component system, cell cycle response regulator
VPGEDWVRRGLMHILLVEPTRLGATLMTRMLMEEGHRVSAFNDGARALAALVADASIDVVMTSLEVPSLSGLELCWEARLVAAQRRPLYIIALSSSYDEAKLVEALDCGADDFVRKPPVKSEIAARLRAAERMVSAQRELIRLATIDPLTNLKNRRAFFETTNDVIAAPIRPDIGSTLSVILFDIDFFKKINDTHGHDAGDDVLREMGRRIREAGLDGARLGGEEFCIAAPLVNIETAQATAERLRLTIADTPFHTAVGAITVTSSFGVAEWVPGTSIEALLKMADVALYAAKKTGRNRVVVSTSDPAQPAGRVFAPAA